MKKILQKIFLPSLAVIFFIALPAKAEAALVYVGGQVGSQAGQTADLTVNFSLTNGVASTPAAGDLVIVAWSNGDTADKALTIANSGGTAYTLAGSELYQNGTSFDANLRVAYRFMPPTPETSVVIGGDNDTSGGMAWSIHVFRNVDPDTPLDVAAVTAGTTGSHLVNPGQILPTTSGALIYVAGAGSTNTGANFAAGYLTDFRTANGADSQDGTIGSGYVTWTSGTYDPAAFTGGGTDSTGDSWAAITLALRPVLDTTTLGDGTDPGNSTIGPDYPVTDIDQFTFTTNQGTDSISAVTVQLLPSNATTTISLVEITDTSNVDQCTDQTIGSNTSNVLNFTGCSIAPGTGGTTLKIRVTPKTHGNMPPVPGASFDVTATTTGWTGSYATKTGTDTDSATITIDNASPANATSVSGAFGEASNTINWTTSAGETSTSTVLRWASGSAGSEVPTEGATYSAGGTITTATVACVFANQASATALSKIDGTGGSSGCTTSALTNGQQYTYKVFQQDAYGNYDAGTTIGTFTPSQNVSVTTTGTQTATLGIPYTNKFVGGAFKLTRSSGSTNVTSLGITVNDSTGLSNMKLYTDTDASCATADPVTNATLFNSTPGSFTANKSTVTGTVAVGTTAVCVYVVLDISTSAADSQTLDLTINADSDVAVAGGVVSGTFPVAIAGSTTLRLPTFNQVTYRAFENIDGTNVTNPYVAENTAAQLASLTSQFRIRQLLHVSTADLSQSGRDFKLQFATKVGGACGDDETFADVTGATSIAYNNNATPSDGDALTANAIEDPIHGGDTIVNQTYEELNNFTNSQGAILSGQDGKWDFALKVNGAASNTSFCFRVVKSDDNIITYTNYPEVSTPADFSLEQVSYRWRNDDGAEGAGGSIVLHPTGQGNYTGSTATGCTEDTGEWDCVNDQAANAGSGATTADDGTSSILTITTGRSSFTLDNDTIPSDATITQLDITLVASEVSAAGGNAELTAFYRLNSVDTDCSASSSFGGTAFSPQTCSFTSLSLTPTDLNNLEIGFLFTLNDPRVTQAYVTITYTQTQATFKQSENIAHTGQAKNENVRLRFLVKNNGPDATGSLNYRLQYAEKSGSCSASTFANVPNTATTQHAEITTSTYFTDQDATSDITGISNPAGTFTAGKLVEDPSNEANTINLANGEFTELEYVFQFNDNATDGGTYCFRVTKNASAISTYTQYPEITLGAGAQPTIDQLHYRWRDDNGDEAAATFATSEDTALTSGAYVGDRRRLRIILSNTGASSATNYTYSLEHASTSCTAWLPVPASATTEHFSMDFSGNVSDGAVTTDVAGLTDPASKSFVSGQFKSTSNQASALTITNTQFTALEYSVKSTASVTIGTTYCFRVTNGGSTANFTYTLNPQIIIQAISNRPTGGGGGGTGESSGSGGAQTGGGTGGGGGGGAGGESGGGGTPTGGGGAGGGGGDTGYLYESNHLASVSNSPFAGHLGILITNFVKLIFR